VFAASGGECDPKRFNPNQLWAVPITTRERKKKSSRFYVQTSSTGREAYLMLSQLRTISSKRLTRKIGTMEEHEFKHVVEEIKGLLP
jgi:mRNA-degrading endonuclease toxin of MazEF toxin-antitoxin module